jgi:hypothetical protein
MASLSGFAAMEDMSNRKFKKRGAAKSKGSRVAFWWLCSRSPSGIMYASGGVSTIPSAISCSVGYSLVSASTGIGYTEIFSDT